MMTTPIPDEEPGQAQEPGKPSPADQQQVKRWAIGIAAAVALCCIAPVVWLVNGMGGDDSDGDSPELRRFDAERVCTEEFVADRLRAPATAEFSDVTVTVSGSTYTVVGSVDAENGFGAMIRSSFECTVRLDGETWRLQSATVD